MEPKCRKNVTFLRKLAESLKERSFLLITNRSHNQSLHTILRNVQKRLFGAPDFSIVVFQMGKVGSRTVQESLIYAYRKLRQPVDIYHSHILAGFDESEVIIRRERPKPEPTLAVINAGRELRQEIDSSPTRQWKIITLVRDPIARNVGTFFQVLDEHIPNWQEKYTSERLTVGEVQRAFLNAGSIHSEPVRWFDEQLLPVFGVDVFNEPFPRETGYKIYNRNSRTPVLLIRLEDLDRQGALAMQEFLGLKNLELINTNIGEEKEYAELYRLFKQKPLPDEYIQEMYSSKYAETFYTPTDIAGFTSKWKSRTTQVTNKKKHSPIIVYQMGKVGSKTIEQSLRHYYQNHGLDVEVYHAHFLNYLDEMEKNGRQQKISKHGLQYIHEMMELKRKINADSDRKWRLISLVRDPVARNIASFFQALSVNQIIPDWRVRHEQGNLRIEELQARFLSLDNDFHNYPATWFESQLKSVFDIDVYEKPFPFQQGYEVYKNKERFDLLVIRMEDLNRCAVKAINQFLDLDDFSVLNSNTSEEKDHRELYNAFKALPWPEEYVTRLYTSRFARNFYNASELESFKKKWVENQPPQGE